MLAFGRFILSFVDKVVFLQSFKLSAAQVLAVKRALCLNTYNDLLAGHDEVFEQIVKLLKKLPTDSESRLFDQVAKAPCVSCS